MSEKGNNTENQVRTYTLTQKGKVEINCRAAHREIEQIVFVRFDVRSWMAFRWNVTVSR